MRTNVIRALLVLFLPAALLAQPAPVVLQTLDLVTPPGSSVVGTVHAEEIQIGERRYIHAAVTTNDGFADLQFDRRTTLFGDGYKIVRETLANTPAVRVERLTASAPDGTAESAVIVWNRQSAEATAIGMERYARLLKGSREALIAAQILPELTFQAAHVTGSAHKGLGNVMTHGDDCLQALLAVDAACVGVILGCGSENPAACLLALYALGTQIDRAAQACPNPYYDDTIGWG